MLDFLKHLFTPRARNNYRAKIIHNSSLLLIVIFLLSASYLAHLIKVSHPEILGVSYSISENDLLNEVNVQRQQNGLSPFTLNGELDDAARRKAADMLAKNYWAHFAPDGSTSPWGFIKAAGYNYQFAGENLAKGFTDSQSVVTAWMNSPSHRENILSSHYKDVGFAIVPGTLQGEDTVLVVEMFGEKPGLSAGVQQTAVRTSSIGSESAQPTAPQNISKNISSSISGTSSAILKTPKIDASITTRAASTVGLTFLAFGFLMDAMIIERKKIPRVVGHNLDHIMLILTFILFLIIMRGGVIV